MKQITITVSDDCEVQVIEQSKKNKEDKKDNKIRTYQDLIDNKIMFNGYYIDIHSNTYRSCLITANKHNILYPSSEKVIKSMIAMAMISQLMPYYGGEITDEEWLDNVAKYLNGDWKPDWNNKHENKYGLVLLDNIKIIDSDCQTVNRSVVYFKTTKLAQQAINILGEETIKLALCTDW